MYFINYVHISIESVQMMFHPLLLIYYQSTEDSVVCMLVIWNVLGEKSEMVDRETLFSIQLMYMKSVRL